MIDINTVTLWAMWESLATYMQNWSGCKDLEQDNGSNGSRISITLTDKRDGNKYTVAKLKDGKCWMTQNLRLQDYTLKPEDSDVKESFILPKSSGYNDFTGSNQNTLGASPRVHIATDPDGNIIGDYNAIAATANSASDSIISRGVDAPYSICPRGWKLPSETILRNLYNRYGASLQSAPANFKYGAHYYDNGQGEYYQGYYWWSTTKASMGSCSNYGQFNCFRSDNGGFGSNCYPGMSVRCYSI